MIKRSQQRELPAVEGFGVSLKAEGDRFLHWGALVPGKLGMAERVESQEIMS